MPGGIGPVSPTTQAACAVADRRLSALGNANEIFFHLDHRRVYYDCGAGQLYFVQSPEDPVGRILSAVLGDAAARLVTEQLHLDVHRCFNAARRVDLDRRQATAVLTALRLVGIHSFVV